MEGRGGGREGGRGEEGGREGEEGGEGGKGRREGREVRGGGRGGRYIGGGGRGRGKSPSEFEAFSCSVCPNTRLLKNYCLE